MNKRIFVAVDVSEETKLKIENYISELKNKFPDLRVGWEKPEKLHLTLKFLGDTDKNQLKRLFKIVENISEQTVSFKLQSSKTGVFPSRKPRILWLGFDDGFENMLAINSKLENECKKMGFQKETREYRTHLTIARLREPLKSGDLIKVHLENKIEPVRFEVSSIVIYESELLPSAGSIYRKLKEFSFSSPPR